MMIHSRMALASPLTGLQQHQRHRPAPASHADIGPAQAPADLTTPTQGPEQELPAGDSLMTVGGYEAGARGGGGGGVSG